MRKTNVRKSSPVAETRGDSVLPDAVAPTVGVGIGVFQSYRFPQSSAVVPQPFLISCFMRWMPLGMIYLLLFAPSVHAQSFATRVGAGVKISDHDGINFGVRYRNFEVLGGFRTPGGVWGFRDSQQALFLGAQHHIGFWRRDRFKIYGFGRLVV